MFGAGEFGFLLSNWSMHQDWTVRVTQSTGSIVRPRHDVALPGGRERSDDAAHLRDGHHLRQDGRTGPDNPATAGDTRT